MNNINFAKILFVALAVLLAPLAQGSDLPALNRDPQRE